MRKMLDANNKAAASLLTAAQKARAAAAAQRQRAQAHYEYTLRDAERITAGLRMELLQAFKRDFAEALAPRLAPQWLKAGQTPEQIAQRLGMPLSDIKKLLDGPKDHAPSGDLIAGQAAQISFHTEGRGGEVLLHWGDQTARFWWEFAGGDALAIINVPEEAHWEAQTGIPLAERAQAIRLIGEHSVRKQSPKGHYAVSGNFITIY